MTLKEALFYLQIDKDASEDEIVDSYENKLFELKQFILNNIPIKSVFEKKIERIHNIFNAFAFFYKKSKTSEQYQGTNFSFTDNIIDAYNTYHLNNNKLKTKILNSFDPFELEKLILDLIRLEQNYAEKWFLTFDDYSNILITKKQDSILLYKELQNLPLISIFTFTDLKENYQNLPEIVLFEMKRLSLFFEKYG